MGRAFSKTAAAAGWAAGRKKANRAGGQALLRGASRAELT